jgi:hypothetical protein
MGEFYLMTRKRLRRQVVEFVGVRGFDDPQGGIFLILVAPNGLTVRREMWEKRAG